MGKGLGVGGLGFGKSVVKVMCLACVDCFHSFILRVGRKRVGIRPFPAEKT